jgi:hypothetical protein
MQTLFQILAQSHKNTLEFVRRMPIWLVRNKTPEVTHPDADLIEEYVMGVRLGHCKRAALAAHFLHCQTCRDICAEARKFVDMMHNAVFAFEPMRDPFSQN